MSAPSAPSREADEAEFAAHDAGAGLAGRLRFNSANKFGRLPIILPLPLFLAAHPKLTVEAVLDDREVDLIEEKQLRETSFAEQPARWASIPPANRSTA